MSFSLPKGQHLTQRLMSLIQMFRDGSIIRILQGLIFILQSLQKLPYFSSKSRKTTLDAFLKATTVLISRIQSGNINWIDTWYFVQGTVRRILYYNFDKKYLRQHIIEQFEYRLKVMNPKCYEAGQCPCECTVPDLQMADKSCDENCYPKMMTRNAWMEYKQSESYARGINASRI